MMKFISNFAKSQWCQNSLLRVFFKSLSVTHRFSKISEHVPRPHTEVDGNGCTRLATVIPLPVELVHRTCGKFHGFLVCHPCDSPFVHGPHTSSNSIRFCASWSAGLHLSGHGQSLEVQASNCRKIKW